MDYFTQLAVYSEENIYIHIQHTVAPYQVLYRSVLGFFTRTTVRRVWVHIFPKSGLSTSMEPVSFPASGGSPGVTLYQELRRGVLASCDDEAPGPV